MNPLYWFLVWIVVWGSFVASVALVRYVLLRRRFARMHAELIALHERETAEIETWKRRMREVAPEMAARVEARMAAAVWGDRRR